VETNIEKKSTLIKFAYYVALSLPSGVMVANERYPDSIPVGAKVL